MTFTPATVVDPVLFGGEPGFTFDPTTTGSRSFVDWPVSSRTMIGVLFRSEDGGLSYTKRYASATDLANAGTACFARQVPYCPAGGGGDTDIDINPTSGSVAMGEQESLANQAVGVSFDHGTTFPVDHVDPALDKTGSGVDRQWQASWAGTKTRFMAYHVPAVGEFVNRSDDDGALGSWSIPPVPQVQGVTQSGSFVADNTGGVHNQALYIGYLGFPVLNPTTGFNVAVSTDGAKTFTSHSVPGSGNARNFTTLSLDKAGQPLRRLGGQHQAAHDAVDLARQRPGQPEGTGHEVVQACRRRQGTAERHHLRQHRRGQQRAPGHRLLRHGGEGPDARRRRQGPGRLEALRRVQPERPVPVGRPALREPDVQPGPHRAQDQPRHQHLHQRDDLRCGPQRQPQPARLLRHRRRQAGPPRLRLVRHRQRHGAAVRQGRASGLRSQPVRREA